MQIKFIDYDGSFPNLCSGTLILEIDGELYSFGGYGPYQDPKHEFSQFWSSGGSVWFSADWEDHIEYGPWEFTPDSDFPEFLKGHEDELMKIFNERVPQGCCGGCL